VNEGDEVAFVEAMKMEIPVASPAAGKIKSMIVAVDEVVTEGQLLGTVET
jgi:biotin carboxyl carrier protein